MNLTDNVASIVKLKEVIVHIEPRLINSVIAGVYYFRQFKLPQLFSSICANVKNLRGESWTKIRRLVRIRRLWDKRIDNSNREGLSGINSWKRRQITSECD